MSKIQYLKGLIKLLVLASWVRAWCVICRVGRGTKVMFWKKGLEGYDV